jgi:uncharacterized repeat protein (TIGR01451 family)
VFGGDAGDGDDGKDNVWRYHVPSVALNNSNLFIYKQPCQYDPTATTCTPLSGNVYPEKTTITYQISYLNTGAVAQSNVVLRDVLPCQTKSGSIVRVGSVSGPLQPLISVPYTTTTTANGNCGSTPIQGTTVTFPAITSLAPGAGGSLVLNTPADASSGDLVTNKAILTSTEIPGGVSSFASTTAGNNNFPVLDIRKTTPTPSTTPGGTAQYVVVLSNTGTGPAEGIQIDDFLPTAGGGTDNPAIRFNYLSLINIQSSGLTTNTAVVTTTKTASIAPTISPYGTDASAPNRVQVQYFFGTNSALAPGGSITVTFRVTVGASMPVSVPGWTNDVVGQSTRGTLLRTDANNTAPVAVLLPAALSLTKTNGVTTVLAGSSTTYTVVVSNGGPSAADGAVVRDVPDSGLSCTVVSCNPAGTTGGATCPSTPTNLLTGSGAPLPSFPANSSVTLEVGCTVNASGT